MEKKIQYWKLFFSGFVCCFCFLAASGRLLSAEVNGLVAVFPQIQLWMTIVFGFLAAAPIFVSYLGINNLLNSSKS
ncbi:MAG: hypothetical protein ACXVAX_04135 [Pseudobdellovibrio sp.]